MDDRTFVNRQTEAGPMNCSHCQCIMRGSAGLTLDGVHYPLCHPDEGMDCYRLVTVYKHPVVGCSCAVAARYVHALATIVGFLGPDRICSCPFPADCGLPAEAEAALITAKEALAGQFPPPADERLVPQMVALVRDRQQKAL